jgi:hypothetical protein
MQEEPSKDEDESFKNESTDYELESKKAPAYSDDMPYSVKVRKRIQKEVAKRAEAEQRKC